MTAEKSGNGHGKTRLCRTCKTALGPDDEACPACMEAWIRTNPGIRLADLVASEDTPAPRKPRSKWWWPVVLAATLGLLGWVTNQAIQHVEANARADTANAVDHREFRDTLKTIGEDLADIKSALRVPRRADRAEPTTAREPAP